MAYTTINKPSDYFNTVLYTGNGSTQNITGVGFDTDFLWAKSRALEVHELYDKVRGATKRIQTQSTAVENTETYQSFITDGFAWSGGGNCNASSVNYVSWNWLANGAGSSNTDGDISSTVSVNDTAGFSIVSYTGNGTGGSTVGHGLSTAPKVVIAKNRDVANGWQVLSVGYEGSASLNETIGFGGDWTNYWGATNPTSSVFTVGVNSHTNGSGNNLIAYCFSEIKGYSKFGSYTGNGSTDGTFVYTGFKPAWVLLKRTDTNGYSWNMYDNKRLGYNADNNTLYANLNYAEQTDDDIDFVSNGFKLRRTPNNQSGADIFYMAFAEHPLVSSSGVPCTAR